MFTTFSGHAIIASPSGTELSLLRLTQRGSIYRQDVTVSISDRTAAQPANRTHEWDADVERLDQKAKDLCPYVGPVAGRHFTQVDLRAAYENISSVEEHNRNGADEVFCSALCRLPAIWEQTEAPVQEVLTMLDVIRAVEEQGTHSCTGFFGGRKLDYQRAFRALIDGNLPVQDVVNCTSWCYNLLDTLRRLPYDFSGDWSAFHERLKKLEAISKMGKSGTPLRREREAREQLIVDLALSCDVFSHRPVSKPHSSDTGMTSATVSGTTKERSSEPAEVAFGYLKPIRNIGVNHYINADKVCMSPAEQDTEVLSPLGVRLLLAEWEVGSDIQNYIYLDPYNTTKSERKPAPPRRKGAEPSTPRAGAQTTLVPSQRPPTVIAAAGAPPAIKAHMELFGTRNAPAVEQSHSQETAFGHPPETFSQELMTSTQVLPGPYGGRVPAGKKKPAKKRMGGF
ncbi:hypothetical protein ID866_7610 [Astraeus odoratus]|nr:hypothetical protein ID866_7610 [Astraeus odoratus]